MPPKKRELQKADSNANKSAPASKKQKRANDQGNRPAENANHDSETAQQHESTEDACSHDHGDHTHKDRNPHDWICVDQPFWDFEHANTAHTKSSNEEDEDEDEDFDSVSGELELQEKYKAQVAGKAWGKPAAELPQYKWKMVWSAWRQMCDLRVLEDYCNPDNFHMYVYNDFESYGIVALVEMKLAEFNKEYNKKTPSILHLWSILSALGHWFQFDNHGNTMKAIHIDDGDRANQLVGLMGTAFLTGIDFVDRMGALKPAAESEILDLGLVISIWLDWSRSMPDYGIEKVAWRKDVLAYAKKGSIDLKEEGCAAVERSLQGFDNVQALKGPRKAGRWKWPSKFKEYKSNYGIGYDTFIPYNLPGYDITKWPRSLRAKWSFDKKDPLADIPEKDLMENKIMLR